MRKIFKLIMIILMILGITLAVINFISVDDMASRPETEGTVDGSDCVGEPLNC